MEWNKKRFSKTHETNIKTCLRSWLMCFKLYFAKYFFLFFIVDTLRSLTLTLMEKNILKITPLGSTEGKKTSSKFQTT